MRSLRPLWLSRHHTCSKTALQYPRHRRSNDKSALIPEEFVAEENVNFCKGVSVNEGTNADKKMVKTSNLLAPPQDKDPDETIQHSPLNFDPSSPLEEGENTKLLDANKQAELMQWHYHLGHPSFP